MKIRSKIYIIFLTLIIGVLPAGSLYSAAFETGFLGDARSIGIGAIAAQCDGSYSVFINPAGLSRLNKQELTLTGGDIYAGLDFGKLFRVNGTYVLPMGKIGSIGIGIDHFMISVEDENSYKYSETHYIISYSRLFSKKLAIGANLKIPRISMDLPGDSRKQQKFSLGLDVGFIFVLNQYLSIGGCAYNLNMPRIGTTTDKSTAARIPVGFKAGLSFDTQKKIMINIDMAYTGKMDLAFGTEFNHKSIFIRGGLQFIGISDAIDLSLGFGYLFKFKKVGIRIDYAFKLSLGMVRANAGTHFISSSFLFSAPKAFGYSSESGSKLSLASYERSWMNDFHKAEKYIIKKNYENAEKFLKKVIEKNNKYPDAYYELACIYSLQNRIDLSVDNIRNVLNLDKEMKNKILKDERLRNVRKSDAFRILLKSIDEDFEEPQDFDTYQPSNIFE